jgi:hypothetical protein
MGSDFWLITGLPVDGRSNGFIDTVNYDGRTITTTASTCIADFWSRPYYIIATTSVQEKLHRCRLITYVAKYNECNDTRPMPNG